LRSWSIVLLWSILRRIVGGLGSGGLLVIHWLLGPWKRRRRSHFGHRRALGKPVRITLQRSNVWNGEVVHNLEGHARLLFEGGPGAAHGQHQQIDGPEDGNGPEHYIADRMPLAKDASVSVDVVAGDSDDARIDRDDGIGLNDHAVEAQFHPTLADEVARIFVVFEAADEIAVDWKNGASVAFGVAKLAEDGVADRCRFGREFRF
jgi:hypothetical protein